MNTEIILIEVEDFMYPAKITKPYTESDKQIQVYIFNDKIREKIGESISISKLAAKRIKPSNGWGTRQLSLQFYRNSEWKYSEDVTEFEAYYLLPDNEVKDRKIELKHIRFPIPIQR